MGKRDKRKKGKEIVKGAAQAKTQQKTDVKLAKQFKKILESKGEEDIDVLLAQLQAKAIVEVKMEFSAPGPRFCASFTPFLQKNWLILFGGEYMDKKQHLYNEMFIFDVSCVVEGMKWKKIVSPTAPPPRSAHQAVIDEKEGILWVFGGEFMSPSQEQFKHYKDMWYVSLTDPNYQWTQVSKSAKSDWPQARSGHRMFLYKRKIIMFGGYQDSPSKLIFFNDTWSFDLDSKQWTNCTASGVTSLLTPDPRGGHCFVCDPESNIAVLYGGIVITRTKSGVEKSSVLEDFWILDLKTMHWSSKPKLGLPPSIRSGSSVVHCPVKRRVYVFGGVSDLETNLDLVSVFHNDMYWLQLDTLRWFEWHLRVSHINTGKTEDHYRDRMNARTKLLGFADSFEVRKARYLERKKGAYSKVDPALLQIAATGSMMATGKRSSSELEDVEEFLDSDLITAATKQMKVSSSKDDDAEFEEYEAQLTAIQSEDFNDHDSDCKQDLKISSDVTESKKEDSTMDEETKSSKVTDEVVFNGPSARRNAMTCMIGQNLFLFGGVIENKDKELTLNDMYCVNVSQSTNWEVIIPPSKEQNWFSAFEDDQEDKCDSEDDDSDDSDDSNSDEDSEEMTDSEDEEKCATSSLSAVTPLKGEKLDRFYERTKEFWQHEAIAAGASESNLKELRTKSFALCKTSFENS